MSDKKYYNKKEFKELLFLFQKELDSGKYTEKIPYETWRKLKRAENIQAEIIRVTYDTPPNIWIFYDGSYMNGIYATSIDDNGFGSFFYNHEIKERKEVTNKEAISKIDSCYTGVTVKNGVSGYWDEIAKATVDEDYYADLLAKESAVAGKVSADEDYYYHIDLADMSVKECSNDIATAKKALSNQTVTISADINSSYLEDALSRLDKLEAELQKKVNKEELEKGKEEKTMKNFNFDFGSCAGNENIRMSMYGIAVKNNSGVWVSYNSQAKEIVDVDILNFEGSKYLYKMPVAIKDVAIGDVIIHNRVPMFVVGVSEDHKNLTVVDVRAGENKTIIPTVNMFGFNFCTKVVSLFNMGTPTADQPFGNMLPLLLMSEGKGADIDPMMLMFIMNQGGIDMTSNPMMMYLMMKDDKDFDPMMMFMMMNQNNHSCHCDKHHEKVESV